MAQEKLNLKDKGLVQVKTEVGEHLVGVIPEVSRRKGLSGKGFFRLLVTDKHLIFTPQASKESKNPVDETPLKIDISQVKTLALNLGSSFVNCCGKLIEEDGSLKIETVDKKYSFSLSPRYAKTAKDILQKAGLTQD